MSTPETSINKLNEIIANYDSDMAKKADTDGVYPDLIAGDLYSNISTTNSDPYLFRKAPDGTRATLSHLTGASVGWNQLVQNGDFASVDLWTTWQASYSVASNEANITLSANPGSLYQDISAPNGHKLFVSADAKVGTASAVSIIVEGSHLADITNTSYVNTSAIVSKGSNGRIQLTIGGTNGQTAYVKNVICIDLTLMFGSAIADEAYAKEQSVAGSGIAWLKSAGFFTKSYYPYDAGSIVSVNTEGRKVVGKNLFEPLTTYPASGEILQEFPTELVLNGFAISMKFSGSFVNAGASFLSLQSADGVNTYITPVAFGLAGSTNYTNQYVTYASTVVTKIKRIIFYRYPNFTNPIFDEVQLEEGAVTDYEPYTTTTYPIPSTDLRGITKLTDGKITYDGDTFLPNGTVNRKYGIVDLGTLTWTLASGLFSCSSITTMPTTKQIVCARYPYAGTFSSNAELTAIPDKSLGCHSSVNDKVFIKDSAYNDAAAFKTAMSGVYLVYELATPTTEDEQEWQGEQMNYVGGTEEFLDDRSVPMPVSADEKVMASLKAPLESIVGALPSADGTYSLKVTMANGVPTFAWN